jgi:hypothetical protein
MPLGDAFASYMQQRQNAALMQRQAQLQQAQMDRLNKQETLRMMLMTNSPQWAREKRLSGAQDQRQALADAQDRAWATALMALRPEQLNPQMRSRLDALQAFFSKNPRGGGKVIQQFLSQGKPLPMQLKPIVTTDENGNPVTNFEVWDPNVGTPPAPMPGTPAGGFSPAAGELMKDWDIGD